MSATRSISDLELPVDEEQRHAMPLSFEEQRKEQEEAHQAQQRKEQAYLQERERMQQRCDELTVAASKAAHAAGRAAAALESHILTHELLENPVQILADPLEDEQMAYHKRNYEDAVDAIRLHLSREFLQDPIRIRPEPADRNLASETEDNEKLIEHHQRRCNEEVAAARIKFSCHRERARRALYAELDRHNAKFVRFIADLSENEFEKLHALTTAHSQGLYAATGSYRRKLCRFSAEREALKIMTIEKRRAVLAWTCPNDGQAYPFTFQGKKYHRTYWGEMWLSENWSWQGYWVGYYIKSGKPPRDDEVSDKIREVLKQ
jgi:hypothetical protein